GPRFAILPRIVSNLSDHLQLRAANTERDNSSLNAHNCLFQLKSIPVFQFKSIPFMVNKKGLEEGIWPMGQIPSSNRRFFRRSPFFRFHNISLFFLSHSKSLP